MNNLEDVSGEELSKEVSRRLTGTRISDEQLVKELSGRIAHLDYPECYDATMVIGSAERDSMIAIEVCECVKRLLEIARNEKDYAG